MKYNKYEVGSILRNLRLSKNYSLTKLSAETGISYSTLIQMERAERNLSMKNLFVLMDFYKVDANTLLGLAEKNGKKSIDHRLNLLDEKKRDYLASSFIYMLENAMTS